MNRKFLVLSIFFILLVSSLAFGQVFTESESSVATGTRSSTLNFFESIFNNFETQSSLQSSLGIGICDKTYFAKREPIPSSSYSDGVFILGRSTTTPEWLRAEVVDAQYKSVAGGAFVQVGKTSSITLNPKRAYNLYWYKCGVSSSDPLPTTGSKYCYSSSTNSCTALASCPTGFTTYSSKTDCDTRAGKGPDGNICPAVVVTQWNLKNNVCSLNPSNSGCLKNDGITSFDSESKCKAKITTPSVDFELSGLKAINGLDNTAILPSYVYYSGGSNPSDLYQLTIKNTGTTPSNLQLEAFYVSRTNPFYIPASQSLRTNSQLQSAFSEGREENPSSCGGTISTRSYTINPIAVGDSKQIYIAVPKSLEGQTLAGSSNFNLDKQYLLVINAYKSCDGANTVFYDQIGGTINFAEGTTPKVPEQDASETPIDSTARQVSVDADDIILKTTDDLLKSSCTNDDMCKSDASCITLTGLESKGVLTTAQVDKKLEEQELITSKLA